MTTKSDLMCGSAAMDPRYITRKLVEAPKDDTIVISPRSMADMILYSGLSEDMLISRLFPK